MQLRVDKNTVFEPCRIQPLGSGSFHSHRLKFLRVFTIHSTCKLLTVTWLPCTVSITETQRSAPSKAAFSGFCMDITERSLMHVFFLIEKRG